jgi:hypothetical protein
MKDPQLIGGILKFLGKTEPQRVYVVMYHNIYDGDNEGSPIVNVTTDRERARCLYLSKAYEYERYFLSRYEEHALINRDDQTMYCECYSETEEYCRTHAVVYVKSFEL